MKYFVFAAVCIAAVKSCTTENSTFCEIQFGRGWFCNTTLDQCDSTYCQHDDNCTATELCDNYMNSLCVPGCTDNSYCYSIFYDWKPACNIATMKCEQANCVNTAGYCSGWGVGYFCNTTTGSCDSTDCYDDAECNGQTVCSDHQMRCVPNCDTQSSTWCSDAFNNGYNEEYSSCNGTDGHCRQKQCDIFLQDCPIDYVCKNRPGWGNAYCARSCLNNDTYCTQTLNLDAEYFCQSSGLCETVTCATQAECDTGQECDTSVSLCTPSCSDDTYCRQMHNYDWNWKCGADEGYCVYRQCYNDTDCDYNNGWTCDTMEYTRWECREPSCVSNPDYCRVNYGIGYVCNTTTETCDYTYCYDDYQCAPYSRVCDNYGMQCVPDCSSYGTQWCSDAFKDRYSSEYFSCNVTNGHCREKPCRISNNNNDCPTDYVCKDRPGWNGTYCARSCNSNDTYCAQKNGDDDSYKCQSDGICARDSCEILPCTESGYACNINNECVPGCTNSTECVQSHHWDSQWECGANGYCVYRECHNDTECQQRNGAEYICNTTSDEFWHCEYPYCYSDDECDATELCDDYMNNLCVPGCTNDTYCDSIFYGMKPICNTGTMKCEHQNCVNTNNYCSQMGRGYYCDITTGNCDRKYCWDNNNCTGTDICDNWYGFCVPGCTNDTYCSSLAGGYKPICDVATMECVEENCINSAGYCDQQGPGYYCNTGTGYCETTSCNYDWDCTGTDVCSNYYMNQCIPDCNTQSTTWCANVFHDEYLSCNGTDGHCREKPCDVINNNNDCPIDYVCNDRPGWSDTYCARSCSNDTYCAQRNNNDESYKCLSDGVCARRPCAPLLLPCTEGGYICNGNSECVPGCTNSTECQRAHYWDVNYECGANGYCVYRQCRIDDECHNMNGPGSFCNTTNDDNWQCDSQWCNYDGECPMGKVCNWMWSNCVDDCTLHSSLWCANVFNDEYLSCNVTNGHCREKPCDISNNNNDCPTDYVCTDRPGWSDTYCARSCSNDTYCAQRNEYDHSYKCQSDGICARDPCDPLLSTCAESGYVCDINSECVPGCTNNTACVQLHYWDYEWECGANGYCVYRQCHNDTKCHRYHGQQSFCDMTASDHWFCNTPYCDTDDDCSSTELCDDYMNMWCRPGCTNDTYCDSIFYGNKPICNVTTMKCEEENCINSAGYCDQQGPGYYCNTGTGYCDYASCNYDYQCTGTDVCSNHWSQCIPDCNTQSTTWCANVFHDEYLSCNGTGGHCRQRPCDVINNNNDCPTDYVCKDDGGWARCARSCTNDTYCAQRNNYDESYKCQSDGLCTRDICGVLSPCTESGYICNGNSECVPGCTNSTNCMVAHHWDSNWECGANAYCVYRQCRDDDECRNMNGPASFCNTTNDDYWQCDSQWCNYDGECSFGQVCNWMWSSCIDDCTSHSSLWCANSFNDEYYSCNVTNGHCGEKPCDISNNNNDCPTDYVCKDRPGWSETYCARSCNNNDTYCYEQYGDVSIRCQSDGSCARDACGPPDYSCSQSGDICGSNNECIPGCVSDYECCELFNWDCDWKCGANNYCIYRQCHNDTECYYQYSSDYVCNMTDYDHWQCDWVYPHFYTTDIIQPTNVVIQTTPDGTGATPSGTGSTSTSTSSTQSGVDTTQSGVETTTDLETSTTELLMETTTDLETITTELLMEASTTEMEPSTTEMQTTEEQCLDGVEDGTCFDTVSSGNCRKTPSSPLKTISDAITTCELCDKDSDEVGECECQSLLNSALDTVKTALSERLQRKLLALCWDPDDCSDIENLNRAIGRKCECGSFECVENNIVVQGDNQLITTTIAPVDESGANTYPIVVAMCIGFIFYIM